MPDRPLRGCELCGQVDTAPRHVVSTPDGSAGTPDAEMLEGFIKAKIEPSNLIEIMDPSTQFRHMDCCAAAGCPGEPGARCNEDDRAGSGLQNAELLVHISGEEAVMAEYGTVNV